MKMHCNDESAKKVHINCKINIHTNRQHLSQQYTGVVHLQIRICICAKKQFEKTNYTICRM